MSRSALAFSSSHDSQSMPESFITHISHDSMVLRKRQSRVPGHGISFTSRPGSGKGYQCTDL